MKKRIIGVIALVLGACAFVAPFAIGLYRMSIESWTLPDWLITYSFIYWPTYIVGLVLIALGIFMLIRHSAKRQK